MYILGKKSVIASLPIKYGDAKMDNLKVSYHTYHTNVVIMLTRKKCLQPNNPDITGLGQLISPNGLDIYMQNL